MSRSRSAPGMRLTKHEIVCNWVLLPERDSGRQGHLALMLADVLQESRACRLGSSVRFFCRFE